jgi:hypothetical protein
MGFSGFPWDFDEISEIFVRFDGIFEGFFRF